MTEPRPRLRVLNDQDVTRRLKLPPPEPRMWPLWFLHWSVVVLVVGTVVYLWIGGSP